VLWDLRLEGVRIGLRSASMVLCIDRTKHFQGYEAKTSIVLTHPRMQISIVTDSMLDPQLFEMTSIAIRRNPIYSLVSRQLKLASTPVPRSCTSSRSFASTAMADAQTAMFLNEKILAKAMTGDLEKVEGKWVLSPSSVSYVRPWHQRDS